MKKLTQKDKKQRRFLAMVPLLALPFICLLFWTLGGGFSANAQSERPNEKGLNTALPDPRLDERNTGDKMSFYQQAAKDSLELEQQMRNDPYYQSVTSADSTGDGNSLTQSPYTYSASHSYTYTPTGDPNVDKVNSRLSRLYGELNAPQEPIVPASAPGADVDRMQAMLQTIGSTGSQDPEMAQLDGMLEKILEIQNPGRVQEKLRERSLKNRKQVYPVSSNKKKNAVQLFSSEDARLNGAHSFNGSSSANGFFEWSDNEGDDASANAVSAIIQQTTTVVTGATIKLRLTDDIYINGTLIKKGTFVYGTCALNGDRLVITLNSIRYRNSLFPVNLTAYDMDGVIGIYMPGAISRDVAKNAAQDAVQGVDYYGLDNSLATQATTVSIQAAKSLLSKKAKLVKVTVKAGYQVLLKDSNSQDQ